jgi:hypothetical protein
MPETPVNDMKPTDVHFPVLPFENVTVDLETHSFGLNNVKWFQVFPKFEPWFRLLHQIRKVIISTLRRKNAVPARIIDHPFLKRREGGRRNGELGFTTFSSLVRRWEI